MTNMPTQPLWLTYFIEILLVLEFQKTKTYFGTFSYKAHFRPQISSNEFSDFPQLGRFTLRDEGKTVAIGKVMKLPSVAGSA